MAGQRFDADEQFQRKMRPAVKSITKDCFEAAGLNIYRGSLESRIRSIRNLA